MQSTTRDDACRWTRWQLCRLVVGQTLREQARDVARHVRSCGDCDDFVDDLAELRSFLLAPWAAEPDDDTLRRQARVALARELQARLARDLLCASRGDRGRDANARLTDLARLEHLADESAVAPETLADVRRALQAGRRPPRRELLQLATRLDPLGLDVALAWMGYLVRAGRESQAQLVADRVLTDWNV